MLKLRNGRFRFQKPSAPVIEHQVYEESIQVVELPTIPKQIKKVELLKPQQKQLNSQRLSQVTLSKNHPHLEGLLQESLETVPSDIQPMFQIQDPYDS